MIINKSVPDISIPFLTGGAAALFASICLPPMQHSTVQYGIVQSNFLPLHSTVKYFEVTYHHRQQAYRGKKGSCTPCKERN